jgi:hypothetical protein
MMVSNDMMELMHRVVALVRSVGDWGQIRCRCDRGENAERRDGDTSGGKRNAHQ